MLIKKLLTIAMLATSAGAFAQNVGVNADGSTPDNSAMLDIKSNTKGVLIPRMTMAERTAIASPATGLLVYQTDGAAGFYYNSGTTVTPVWTMISNSGDVQGTLNGLLIGQGSGNPSTFIAPGANNQFLSTPSMGGAPQWTSPSNVTGSAVVTVNNGNGQSVGMGDVNVDVVGAPGAVLYGTGTSSAFSSAGNVGDILVSGGTNAPVWASPNTTLTTSSISGTGVVAVSNGGGQTVGTGNVSLDVVGTSNGILYGTGTSSAFTPPSTAANQVLATPVIGGTPQWVNANTTLATNNISPGTSSAVVVTNGNNQVVGTSPVTVDVQGAAGGVMYGAGSGAPAAFTPAGTAGQYLKSAGSAAPSWATPVSYFSVPTPNGGNAVATGNFTMSGGYVTWSTSGSPYTNTISTQLVLSGSFYQATSNVNFLRSTGSMSMSGFGAGTFNVVLVKYSNVINSSCGSVSQNFNLAATILGSCSINFGSSDISGKWDIDLTNNPASLTSGDILVLMVQNATGTTRTWYGTGTATFSTNVQ